MATVEIDIDGTDVTSSVVFADAEFNSSAKNAVGTCNFRIRDLDHLAQFVIGKEIQLKIDGILKWGGWVSQIGRGFFVDVADTSCDCIVPRYFRITGVDYNILLNKRLLYDKVDGRNLILTNFPPGTSDQDIIVTTLTDHSDLLADGIDLSTVEAVGSPFQDDNFSGMGGETVGNFLSVVGRNLGAVWYIRPDKSLVYTDQETGSATYDLSDKPVSGDVGFRDGELDNIGSNLRNDALVWGVGQGSSTPVFARVIDTPSRSAHGLWQVGNFNQGVWRQATVNHIANSYVYGSPQSLRGGKDDQVASKVTVFTPDFGVAQKTALKFWTGQTSSYNQILPIRSERITFPTPVDPEYELSLGFDVDEPWSTFEYFPIQPLQLPPPPRIPKPHLPKFNPCVETGICRNDTFGRTIASGWGTPSDAGSDWVSQPVPDTDPPVDVDPSHGGRLMYHQAMGPSGLNDRLWTAGLDTSGCISCSAADIYWDFSLSWHPFSSAPRLAYNVSADQWQIPDRTNGDIQYEQYAQIQYGSRNGHAAIFGYDEFGNLKCSLGQTNTPYFSAMAAVDDENSYDDDQGHFSLHLRLTNSSTSLTVWTTGLPEPAPQFVKSVSSIDLSSGSATELGGTIQLQSGAITYPGSGIGSGFDNFTDTSRFEIDTSRCGGSTIPWQIFDYRSVGSGGELIEDTVDGSRGNLDPPFGTSAQGIMYAKAFGAGAVLPVEVLYKLRAIVQWDTRFLDMAVSMSGGDDPFHAIRYFWTELEFNRGSTGGYGTHTLALAAWPFTSESSGPGWIDHILDSPTLHDNESWTVEVYVRMRLETNAMRMRIWQVGTTEPGAWTYEDTSTDESPIDNGLVSVDVQIFGIDSFDSQATAHVDVDDILIVDGCVSPSCEETFSRISDSWGNSEFGGDNPCSGPNPPPPDPPASGGYLCENLTRIDNTVGGDSVYQSSGSISPGTSELYVDGERLYLGSDYTESGNTVIIDTSVDVGGGDPFDPPKVVYMCYVVGA